MSKTTKRRLRTVAIFVIFLALAVSGFQTYEQFSKRKAVKPDFGKTDSEFRDTRALYKAELTVSSDGSARKKFEAIKNKYSPEDFTPEQGGAFIFKVDRSRYDSFLQEVESLGSVSQAKSRDSLLTTNPKKLETEQEILDSKISERTRLRSLESSYTDVSARIRELDQEIRDLENVVGILSQHDTILVYVKLITSVGTNTMSLLTTFVKSFFGALAIGFVAAVLAYYGTILIMYLLSLMGVKGFTGSNLGTNYQYGYGNYSNRYYSRYGGSKRKVKRIYKDKRQSGKETPEETNPEEANPEEPGK